jgi:hypothetical protein
MSDRDRQDYPLPYELHRLLSIFGWIYHSIVLFRDHRENNVTERELLIAGVALERFFGGIVFINQKENQAQTNA